MAWQLRFSLYQLLVLTFACAVAASRFRLPGIDWEEHVLAIVAVLMVIGLLHECRDLWRAHRGHRWESREAERGWQAALVWRGLLALLLTATLVVPYLEAYGVIELPELEEPEHLIGKFIRAAILRLALLVGLTAGLPRMTEATARRLRSIWIDRIGWVAAFLLCVLIVEFHVHITLLLHIALKGIHDAQPLLMFDHSKNPAALLDLRAPSALFFRWASLSVALLPFNCWLICVLIRQWRRGTIRRRRCEKIGTGTFATADFPAFSRFLLGARPIFLQPRSLALVALTAGLAVPAGFAVWAWRTGFPAVSPFLGPWLPWEPVHRWIAAAVLVLLASAAAGWQLVMNCAPPMPVSNVKWQLRPADYFHRRWICILTAVAVSAISLSMLILSYVWRVPWWQNGSWDFVVDLVVDICVSPWYLLNAALLLAALRAARFRWRGSDGRYSQGPFALPISVPGLLTTVFAVFVVFAAGVPTLYWFIFVLYVQSGSF